MAPLHYIAAILLTLDLACYADVVNLRAASQSSSICSETKWDDMDTLGDSELLDIVLVASVDGKFHALNRSTGHTLWSISSFASSRGANQPSTLAPLVRTSHIDPDLTDEGAYQETYIIEPQYGEIYIMATPSSPLQRFPFSMSQLVDMSPFSFAAADDHRIFVGRKELSLLLVELETGDIKDAIDSQCPRDPFEDLRDEDQEPDLDKLDGSKPEMLRPTEVFIGRTDYHIDIHSRSANGSRRVPVQTLSFSTYGPNNQDSILQESYKNTKDDVYIQSLPNGEIISFKVKGEAKQTFAQDSVLWANKYNNPIVAIFDVLRTPAQHPPSTFVLLQPRPPFSAILPNLNQATSMDQLPHFNSVYIGLVEETGSLFAMSPDQFPMVAFGAGKQNRPKMVDSVPETGELASEVSAITKARKQREGTMMGHDYGSEDDRCMDRNANRRYLVGMRELKGGDGDGPEMRMKRLIDGVSGVPLLWEFPLH
ncbi:hypothetical protein DFH07DRAFT_775880 [Mycena maculata]|uniref:ER membrane protein complex subunit 1 n=1 Tax=Mycena maculata TaxID=230809 RepID=A0AAD7IRB1_9AGAR|nr:hypothetical protein DFH07DRAFT_775880 [Mycena maculata]